MSKHRGLVPQARQPQTVVGSQANLAITHATLSVQTSPLPPPDVLRGYSEVRPELVDLVMDQVTQQATHRRNMEAGALRVFGRSAALGAWLGFAIGMTGLICACIMTVAGHGTAGAVLGSVDLVALVSVFVQGRRQQHPLQQPPLMQQQPPQQQPPQP